MSLFALFKPVQRAKEANGLSANLQQQLCGTAAGCLICAKRLVTVRQLHARTIISQHHTQHASNMSKSPSGFTNSTRQIHEQDTHTSICSVATAITIGKRKCGNTVIPKSHGVVEHDSLLTLFLWDGKKRNFLKCHVWFYKKYKWLRH